MEHIAAILVLIGCGHGDVSCEEVPAPTVAYETVEMCERDMERVLRESSDRYPVTYGTCELVDPALFEGDAVVAWDFTPTGELNVDVIADGDVMLADIAAAE